MTAPLLSVLLPVYNAGRYLREAIDSVLQQSFTGFELLLVNDGSTDGSEEIILSYNDPRIVYIKNERNSGLIFSLNRGIDAAKGKYIARMDSDDICLPQRFEKQLSRIEATGAAVVACTVIMIDASGSLMAPWTDDRNTVTPESIRAFLPKDNCIAHPSVMMEAKMLKAYRYNPEQREAEDYDLWLRLAADDRLIDKVEEPLLYYRFLTGSLTRKDRLSAAERLWRTKKKFLSRRWKENALNGFTTKVAAYACFNGAKAFIKKKLS
jgi:glycosyltransferase involved in cell wall biosynthesis